MSQHTRTRVATKEGFIVKTNCCSLGKYVGTQNPVAMKDDQGAQEK